MCMVQRSGKVEQTASILETGGCPEPVKGAGYPLAGQIRIRSMFSVSYGDCGNCKAG